MIAIEAGGDEDEVGGELSTDRQHHLGEGTHVLAIAEPGRERQVERPPGSGTLAYLLGGAGARIERVLMGRDVEHVRIALEEMLRAVAVMQVPVDDHHAPEAAAPEPRGGDGDVVEEAEAHRAIALRMVAGRTDEREAVRHLSREDGLADDEEAARGQARRLV